VHFSCKKSLPVGELSKTEGDGWYLHSRIFPRGRSGVEAGIAVVKAERRRARAGGVLVSGAELGGWREMLMLTESWSEGARLGENAFLRGVYSVGV